jgi:hypothetical protein
VTPDLFLDVAVDPALTLLPARMTSVEARALVLAIAFQESALEHRRQQPVGPARGYCQFEEPGVAGVLTHRASRVAAHSLCSALDIEPSVAAVHRAIEFNDVLMAGFARLLLWTVPDPLPSRFEFDRAWRQYVAAWRPGKPKPTRWPSSFALAWNVMGAKQ